MGLSTRAAIGQQRPGRGPLNERGNRVRRRPVLLLRSRLADRQAPVVCGDRRQRPCGAGDLSGGRRTVRGNCGGTKSIDIRLAKVPTHGWHVTFGFRERVRAAASAVLPSPIKRSLKRLVRDRKSTRLNSSHVSISYAVFCLKKKKKESKQNQS